MRQITLMGVVIDVKDGEGPNERGVMVPVRILEITDPQRGEVILVGMPQPVADEIAAKLRGVFITTQMPGNGNGHGR
jgi:hypothetical protein